jgi:hypothetical protein
MRFLQGHTYVLIKTLYMLDAFTLDNRALVAVSDITVVAVSGTTLGVSWATVSDATQYLVQWGTAEDFTSSQVYMMIYCNLPVLLTACFNIA